jgi:invasion protein IalB
LLTVGVSQAWTQNFHGQYVDWTFFSNKQGKNLICYLTAIPIKKESGVQNRGEPYFIITKTTDKLPEISVATGYYYKSDSEVKLSFGLRKFYMLTYKSKAWTYSVDDDIEIIKAMKDSDKIIVTATSDLNKVARDTYSLIGFNKAYKEFQKKCE